MRFVKYKLITLGIFCLRKLAGVLEPFYNRLVKVKGLYYDFRMNDNDIMLVSFPKSGTTWLQMVMYQLLTDGEMNFTHIRDEIPFLEQNIANGKSLAVSRLRRRVYASHLSYGEMPKGSGKYIYIMRDGMDVLMSLYHHAQTSYSFKGSLDEYFKDFKNARERLWASHVHEWVSNRDNLDLLLLRYEDLQNDLASCIRRIADFCQIDLAESQMQRVVERSSFSFMKRHEPKFDMNTYLIHLYGFSNTTNFIRQGLSGKSKEYFTPEQAREFCRLENDRFLDNPYLKAYKEDYAIRSVAEPVE